MICLHFFTDGHLYPSLTLFACFLFEVVFLSSTDVLLNKLQNIISGIPSVSNSLEPDQAQCWLGLIWALTVSRRQMGRVNSVKLG